MPFIIGRNKVDAMEKITVRDFDLKQTLECGQCFNFEKIYDAESGSETECVYEYDVIAFGRWLRIRQEGNELIFINASAGDVQNVWIPYFDLDRDYAAIKKAVIEADPSLKEVVEQYYGIRILNQDFTETLISFIISQNKNIPHIKQLVRNMSEKYGTLIAKDCENGREYYSFPDIYALNGISKEGFRELKTGFRAPYLRDAVDKLVSGKVCEADLKGMNFDDARECLKSIKGVGDKVANCVLLFGLGFRDAFPVDVWIKRIMEELYFHRDTDKKIIEQFAREKFGRFGGYAQQYLFIYARNR